MNIKIPGLDVKKGLDLYDGDEEIYILVLKSFAKNIPASLSKLKNVSLDTLSSYQIGIHGIKGTSANIGAENLRIQASELEILAKTTDISSITEKNDIFIKQAEDLINEINSWLSKNAPDDDD